MITRLLNTKTLTQTFQGIEHNMRLMHTRHHSQFSTIVINNQKKQSLGKMITKLENPYSKIPEIFSPPSTITLPSSIRDGISQMKKSNQSLLLLKNLPTGYIPKTGNLAERIAEKSYASEHILLSIAKQVGGTLFTSEKSKHPAHIHQVAPQKGHYHEANGLGLKDFHFHVEEAYEADPINYLVLSCLEGDTNAKTSFMFLEDILSNIPKDILRHIPFQFESGSDFSEKEILTSPILTFDQENNTYHTRLYENEQNGNRAIQMKATCTTGAQLLTDIQDRIANLKIAGRTLDLDLEPGDVAIINNGIGRGEIAGVMHTRKGTIQNPNRWLQRVYLKQSHQTQAKKPTMFSTTLSSEGVCKLTLTTNKTTNPFSDQLMNELTSFFKDVNQNEQIKSLIIYGGEGNSFSAGGDFNEVSQLPYQSSVKTTEWIDRVISMYKACLDINKPVIMAVDHHCIGIGFQLAMCADRIIATENTTFTMPELKGGIACTIGSYMLETVFSRSIMLDLTFSCKPLDIYKAVDLGFVANVTSSKHIVSQAERESLRCQSFPETSFKTTKLSRNREFITGLTDISNQSKEAHTQSFKHKTAEDYMYNILKR